MNELIKQKWIEALESDQYIQARSALKTKHGYCCLGVLCDLYMKEHPETSWQERGSDLYVFVDSTAQDMNTYDLPDKVVKWAEIPHGNPIVKTDRGERPLANVNDWLRKPFKEIAKMIRKSL